MDVARDIHAVFLRAARSQGSEAYDLNTTIGNTLRETIKIDFSISEEKKQYLRDFMNSINLDEIKTAEELYNFITHSFTAI